MRITYSTSFLFIIIIFSVMNAHAQACGGAFNTIKVSDSSGKNISGVIIEIVAQLPREEYDVLGYGKTIKMSVPDAEAAVRRDSSMRFTEDIFCKNPLKQYAGVTKVKNIRHYNKTEPSVENLGFCTGEIIILPLLLKVYAPGYLTNYYVGNYLGGCGSVYEFILTNKKKRKVRKAKKS